MNGKHRRTFGGGLFILQAIVGKQVRNASRARPTQRAKFAAFDCHRQ